MPPGADVFALMATQPEELRALPYILPGHVMHHIESLKQDYHVGG